MNIYENILPGGIIAVVGVAGFIIPGGISAGSILFTGMLMMLFGTMFCIWEKRNN